MNNKIFAALAAMSMIAVGGCGQPASPPSGSDAAAAAPAAATVTPPNMAMTTEIPASVTIPDVLETRLGTLRFDDGFPTQETADKIYDQLDFQRGVESVILNTGGASLQGFRNGIREFGPDNTTAIIWEERMDSKVILLTPNTTVIYVFQWLDLKDGPLVMETPPNVLGIIDDHWFRYVTDFGNAGPDRGQGGKYLLLPPGYDGDVPDGYHVAQSATFGNWLVMRGFLVDGDPKPGVESIKKHFKMYPLGAENPPPVNWVNVSMKGFNTNHPSDFTFFEEINQIVQEEPNEAQNPEILGLLAAIGIEKGKPFAPDARLRETLEEAALVGNAASRVIEYRNREESFAAYPGSNTWETGFPGGSHEFLSEGVRLIDQRVGFHFYATGITPKMVNPGVGVGSQYMKGIRDSNGQPMDGGKTYRLHIPPNVPANNFWAVTVYDVQTRSMLQTDQRFPEITSVGGVEPNADGSYDVYFGPVAPEGKENNWLQTVPGKGWHILWRIYGPLEPWFDKSWRPGEIELVK